VCPRAARMAPRVALRAVLLVVLLFILVPIAELCVIIKVGGAIGILPTLALLIGDALLGSWLLRHQGRAAWVGLNRALAENRLPHKEVMDGVLIVFGGALLLTPGFITDIFGFILLIPPTRALVRAFAARSLRRRMAAAGPGGVVFTFGGSRPRTRRRPAPGGPGPGPGGARARPGPGQPDLDDPFSWEDPVGGAPPRGEPHPDDIEGTGHEIRDEDELPPGREPFGG
jgi:UPF0716 protein FxsA